MSSIKNPKNLANNFVDAAAEPEKPLSSPGSSCSSVPPLAVRCDGRVLLATVDLEDVDLSKREIWVGIVLTEAEAADVHERIDFEQAASPTAARIIALDKKAKAAKKSEPSDDNNDE